MTKAKHEFRITNCDGHTGGVWGRPYATLEAAAEAIAQGLGWDAAQLADWYQGSDGSAKIWHAWPAGEALPAPGSRADAHAPQVRG